MFKKSVIISKLLTQAKIKLKLDIEYFAKGSFFSAIQQLVGVVSGGVVIYLLGHFVSQQVFGNYNLLLSTISLVTFFSLPGIDTALTQSVGSGKDNSLSLSLRSKTKYSLLGSLALIGFAGFYYAQNMSIIGHGLVIAALFFPFLHSFSIYVAFFTAKHRFDILALFASIASVFFLLTMSLSIFIFGNTLGLILGYLLGVILPSVFGFIYTKRYQTNQKKDFSIIPYGRFLTILSILPWISGNLGKILIGNLLGIQELALYSVAIGFVVTIQKQLTVFYKPLVAKLAAQSKKQHFETLRIHTLKLVTLGLSLSIMMWFLSPFLVSFFYQASYQPAIHYTRWLSLSIIPLPLSWALTNVIVFQKRKKAQIITNSIPHLVMIGLYLILIPKWGVMGLIMSFLVERFLTFLIPLFFLSRDQMFQKS